MYKPKVIAITEVEPRIFNHAELNDFENSTFRGALLYIDKTISAKQVSPNYSFQGYFVVELRGVNETLFIFNVNRRTSSSADNNTHTFNFIKCLSKLAFDELLLLGDFNLFTNYITSSSIE